MNAARTRTPVLQFGTSRFLQAHVDLFIDEAAREGQSAGPITVVAGSGQASGKARIAAFNNPDGYPVVIRGLEDGVEVERHYQVTSIKRGLAAVEDWAELLRVFVEDAEFVVSNTTEQGYAIAESERVDLKNPLGHIPASFPGRLLAGLAARFNAGGEGLILLPTELISRNGDMLKSIVGGLAERCGASSDLMDFIGKQCVFANSLVDRIVSTPIEPIGAVAEPYALWAVEDQPGLQMPCTHPAIKLVPDLEPYARLKIHILNLGHTSLAENYLQGRWRDDITVREMLADPATREELLSLYRDEIIPGFEVRGMGEEARAYVATTLDRFANPFLDHRFSDIVKGHKDKIRNRAEAFLTWVEAVRPLQAPRLRALIAAHAEE